MPHDPRTQPSKHHFGPDLRPRRRADRGAGHGNVEHPAVQVMPSASSRDCPVAGGAMRSWRLSRPHRVRRGWRARSAAPRASRACAGLEASLSAKPPSNSRTTRPRCRRYGRRRRPRARPCSPSPATSADRRAAGRNVDQPAGMLLLVLAHEAAGQLDGDALMAAPVGRSAAQQALGAASENRWPPDIGTCALVWCPVVPAVARHGAMGEGPDYGRERP